MHHDPSPPTPKPPLPPQLLDRLSTCAEDDRTTLRKTWTLAGLADDAPEPDLDALWHRLDALAAPAGGLQHPTPGPAPSRPPTRRPARRPTRARMLARLTLAALVLTAAFGGWWWLQPIVVTAPAGATPVVHLPDGSQATLNSGTRLGYQRPLLGWDRTLELDGEAFFDVVPDAQPFAVHTFNAVVTVLGTRFNVRAWPGDAAAETQVALATGAVSLAAASASEQPVRLSPGEMSRVTTGAALPTPAQAAPVDRLAAWRSGGFAFDGHRLDNILREVARRYGVSVTAEAALRETVLALFLDAQPDAAAVLDVVCSTARCRVAPTGDGFHLTPIDPP